MTTPAWQVPAPAREADFEELCVELFRNLWGDQTASQRGSRGQLQSGVDIVGRSRDGKTLAVQCKVRDSRRGRGLTRVDIEEDVKAARQIEPKIDELTFATTAFRSAALQDLCRKLSDRELTVTILFWDDILSYLAQYPKICARFFPTSILKPFGAGETLKVSLSRMPPISSEFIGRRRERDHLTQRFSNHEKIACIYGFGGMGKTALVRAWIEEQLAAGTADNRVVFGYTFASQETLGAGAFAPTSADPFAEALSEFLGIEIPPNHSPIMRGELLAQAACNAQAIILLDGVEALLSPTRGDSPTVEDPILNGFMSGIQAGEGAFCILTSRVRPSTLPRKSCVELQPLTAGEALRLLRSVGIKGSRSDLVEAIREWGRHPLTIALLGGFVREALGGDIHRLSALETASLGSGRGGDRIENLLTRYLSWLRGTDEFAVFLVLGLFDGPAEHSALNALRHSPVKGLTDRIGELGDTGWDAALTRLRDLGLVSTTGEASGRCYHTHQIVQLFLRRRLQRHRSRAFESASAILSEYYVACAPPSPESISDLLPLYRAVFHACAARLHEKALLEIYDPLIRRGDQAFSVKVLGAFGLDLACLANFFDGEWTKPRPEFSPHWQAELLNFAGFRLRGVGRVKDGIAPMEKSLTLHENLRDAREASNDASNLSQFYLSIGQINKARLFGQRAVKHAKTDGDAERVSWRLTDLAEVLSV